MKSFTPRMGIMVGKHLLQPSPQKIREQDRDVLIFFLTDRTEKADRLKGFDMKGNDYIPKPFYPEELIAKIKERFEHRQPTLPSRITIGQTIFDSNLSTIEYAGTVLHLSARQSEIFTILAQHIGQTVERSYLLEHVWGNDSYANSLALNVVGGELTRWARITTMSAVSWASPKRPSAPQDTGLYRILLVSAKTI